MTLRAVVLYVLALTVQFGHGQVPFRNVQAEGNVVIPDDTTLYVLPPGEFWNKQSWRDSVYLFPKFQKGSLSFDTGFSPETQFTLNYNIFLETVDLIDENGEVRVLENLPLIARVAIGDKVFIHSNDVGYVVEVTKGAIALGVKPVMLSAYETGSHYRYRPTGFDMRHMAHGHTRYYWPSAEYYFIVGDRKVHKASLLALTNLLPKHKDRLRDFSYSNRTDFRKREDVNRIVAFSNELAKSMEMEEELLVLDGNTTIQKSAWRDSIYRFSEFRHAVFTYEGGGKIEVPAANYNRLTGWFDQQGRFADTTAVSRGSTLMIANLDGVHFMNTRNHGLLEVVLQGKIALAARRRIVQVKDDALVAKGSDGERMFKDETLFYFISERDVYPASARSIASLHLPHKSQVNQFIAKHSIRFDRQEDLVRLLSFCAAL